MTTGRPYRPQRTLAYAILLLVILPFCYLYFVSGLRFFLVPTGSMIPTLVPSDYLATFPEETYARGDIVVLRDPLDPDAFVVKRLVAFENEIVSAAGGALFVDGGYVSEPYLPEPILYNLAPYQIGPGQIFVLGDNRNQSLDSHSWARRPGDARDHPGHPMAVPMESVVGKVHKVYLPFNRIRDVESYPLRVVDLSDIQGDSGNPPQSPVQ